MCFREISHTIVLEITFKPNSIIVLEMTGEPTMEYSISAFSSTLAKTGESTREKTFFSV